MSVKQKFVVAALGDSITVGYNAESSGDNRPHSWVTGDSTALCNQSHLQRIRQIFPSLDVVPANVAFHGARASDLKMQVSRLTSAPPDYVTLLIGANDLPQWMAEDFSVPLYQFKQDVFSALSRLVELNTRTMILLVSIPDQSHILHLAPTLRNSAFVQNISIALRARLREVNRVFAEVADEFRSNVRYVTSVSAAKFSPHHLSTIDFYHPSIEGQKLLATSTWNEGFFP